ncbi:hypothetical protein KL918_001226 [Ogataea parapolymorpha]|uniref:Transcription factor CPH1 n=1 Tax=Ogataea parapolymorpha (strain ATCC 26012 / BCRC 20466 / JCM 22074 / NRRL Y-7560 / DL-1) TaxID=871575 RepID=W1QHN8_OGAPD|nr:Transcription factor CPH1 [Ogataea parapolymorpha DL-1]ESW99835.1 Transcription factor CPH1 [Ogataea parapolymorpha DL-1]KAG7868583.1 hypothetical protein KL918_001226 [Ogataea parapolymorpha]KAG7874634.1 hypothetical protein KL916_001400 [Ogataea parapolymorpha]
MAETGNGSVLNENPTARDQNHPETPVSSVETSLRLIDDLKFFLATAPVNWHENQVIRRYFLNKEEGFVSCVYWNNLYFITGTDIVRCIAYKIHHFGRTIIDRKKFEEGIFSDLRALKCGTDAVLENPRSPFLKFLHKNQCLRTQKKQKVFFWFSVPHDKLFAEALERDLKKEYANQPATTRAMSEPSLSLKFDHSMPLADQILKHLEKDSGMRRGDIYDGDTEANIEQVVRPPASDQKTMPSHPSIKEEINSITTDDDDFPLDFLPAESAGFSDHLTSSSQDAGYISYGHHPSLYMDPTMFTGSPGRALFMDDYLLDQATPVVPVMYSTQQHRLQSGGPPSATNPLNLRMTPRVANSLRTATPKSATFAHAGHTTAYTHAYAQQQTLQLVPSPTTLANGNNPAGESRSQSRSGNSDKEDPNSSPQVLLSYPSYPTNGGPMLDMEFDPFQHQQVVPLPSGGHFPYGIYGPSPYYSDFPLLPYSQPLSAAFYQSPVYQYFGSAKGYASMEASSSHQPPRSAKTKDKMASTAAYSGLHPSKASRQPKSILVRDRNAFTRGGRITKNVKVRGKQKLMNPSLQHLDLDSLYDENGEAYSDVSEELDTRNLVKQEEEDEQVSEENWKSRIDHDATSMTPKSLVENGINVSTSETGSRSSPETRGSIGFGPTGSQNSDENDE